MSHTDKYRESPLRAARTQSRSGYRLQIGRVTVSADELRSWQLGPLSGGNDQNAQTRHDRRS